MPEEERVDLNLSSTVTHVAMRTESRFCNSSLNVEEGDNETTSQGSKNTICWVSDIQGLTLHF